MKIYTILVDTREFTSCSLQLNDDLSPEFSTKLKLMFTDDKKENTWQKIYYNAKGNYFVRYGDRVYLNWDTLKLKA